MGGFSLAFYIHKTKRSHKALVCPLDGHCDAVVQSEYSKFFGVPVEIFGMAYYASVVIGYGLFLAFPDSIDPWMSVAVSALTLFSFLFSTYLTFIQAFNLRQWCTWCLTSAGLCSFIFVTSIFSLKFGVVSIPKEIFEEIYDILMAGHLLAAALGLGVSVVSTILFFKFVKDFKISDFEADIMHIFSQIIWFSIFILVLTGFGLYFSSHAKILSQPLFFAYKTAAIFSLLATSAVFNLLLAPKLIKKSVKAEASGSPSRALYGSEVRTSLVFNSLTVFSCIFVFMFAVIFKF